MSENREKRVQEKKGPKKLILSGKSAVWISVVCAVAVILGSFVAYAASYSEIFPRVTVNDISVGGMSKDEARSCIDEAFEDAALDRQVTLKCGGNSTDVVLSDMEIQIDSEKIVEEAFAVGRSGGAFRKTFSMIASIFSKNEVPLSVNMNREKLEKAIGEIAAEYEIPMTETTYELDGNTLNIIKGKSGEMIDREKAVNLLAQAVADESITEIELVVEAMEPREVELDEFYADITQPAKDAEYKLEDGKVIVVPDRPQITVDKAEVKKALESSDVKYGIEVKVDRADVTEEELQSLLFRDVMGQFSSDFSSSSAARASNVSLTAQRINDYVLMPGDVFSYDKTVGSRTVANGYKEAGVYVGNKVESGIGGGICQTSSTLYCAALYANLEIVQRTSHSLPVTYVPKGQDATIAEGYIDLKIKNDTEYPVKIVATVSGRRLTCQILGVKPQGQTVEIVNTITANYAPQVERTTDASIPEGYKKVLAKGAAGYGVATTRIVKENGAVVKTEKMTSSTYRAAPIEEVVNPADKGTPSEQLKVYDEKAYKKEQEELAKQEAQQKAEAEAGGAAETPGTGDGGGAEPVVSDGDAPQSDAPGGN